MPRHAVEAHDVRETGMSLSMIGAALGISKRLADWASQIGAAMAARGLSDPFVRLSERPERVSRWNRERGRRDDSVSRSLVCGKIASDSVRSLRHH